MNRHLRFFAGVMIFLFACASASAAITVLEPAADDLKNITVSFDPHLSFLAKSPEDILDFRLEVKEFPMDPEKTIFRVLIYRGDSFIRHAPFSIDNAPPVNSEPFTEDKTFRLSFTYGAAGLGTQPSTQHTYDIEMGFYASISSRDPSESVNVPILVDPTVPTVIPKVLVIEPSDSGILVKLDRMPEERYVRFVVLAYGKEADVKANLKDLNNDGTPTPDRDLDKLDILEPYLTDEDYNGGTVCFQVLDISNITGGQGMYFFDGIRQSTKVTDPVPCDFDIENDTAYLAAAAFANEAGNLVMSPEGTSRVVPSKLYGLFDEDNTSCTSASLGGGGRSARPAPFGAFPFMLAGLIALMAAILRLRRRGAPRCTARASLFVIALLCLAAVLWMPRPAMAEDAPRETYNVRPITPDFGLFELMYGYFPMPRVTAGNIKYYRIFSPDPINISSGPSAIMLGLHWFPFRLGNFFEVGPFARVGFGIQRGAPFFIHQGKMEFAEDQSLNLYIIPVQAGGSLNFHFLNRLLALGLTGGIQWSNFNQGIEGRSSGWYGNFAYFGNIALKLNINFLEPDAVWNLFYSWGIKSTYLSINIFFMGNMTGKQVVFDNMNRIKEDFFQNTGWFVGLTFEI